MIISENSMTEEPSSRDGKTDINPYIPMEVPSEEPLRRIEDIQRKKIVRTIAVLGVCGVYVGSVKIMPDWVVDALINDEIQAFCLSIPVIIIIVWQGVRVILDDKEISRIREEEYRKK